MAHDVLELRGVDLCVTKLKTAASMKAHKKIIEKHTSKLQKAAKRKAVFTGHYKGKKFINPTGATKNKINLSIEDGGFTGRVKAGTDYSGYLEKGTRKMTAQPFMKPALNEVFPKFVKDMKGAGLVK